MRKNVMAAVAVMLCLILTGCGMFRSETKESLTRWVTDNREAFEKIARVPRAGGRVWIDREMTDMWSGLFRDGRLEYVTFDPETGDYALYFNGSWEPEGDRYLKFSDRPIGKIEPISGDTGTLEEMTDDRLYRTGVGVGGRGYTLVERIAENWWFIEIYWPT
ncbi:MAG: hypothetical protein IJR97_09315 [Clostridia bacterium]|nr:hypothetical protein [Clostridia bacterium]